MLGTLSMSMTSDPIVKCHQCGSEGAVAYKWILLCENCITEVESDNWDKN